MTTAALTRSVNAPLDRIRTILLSPVQLPDWNPAFVRIDGTPAAIVGTSYRLEAIRGMRGTFTYTRADPEWIAMHWQVPGLSEDCSWALSSDSSDGRTKVTHSVSRSGILATLTRSALDGLPALRLERLAALAEATSPPAVEV